MVPEGLPSKLYLPIEFPAQFQLHATVTRLRGGGPLVLGMKEDGRSFYVLMDAPRPDGRLTGLGTKGGSLVQQKNKVLELKQDQPTELLLAVGANSVSLIADGETILDWQGDLRELFLGGGWGIEEKKGLLIGGNDHFTSFEISRLELVPVTADATPKSTDES